MDTSPDLAAAQYEPTWRDRSLPQPGDTISLRALVDRGTAFLHQCDTSGTVASAALRQRGLAAFSDLIVTLDGHTEDYLLRASSPNCDWALWLRAERKDTLVALTEAEAPVADTDDESVTGMIRRLIAIKNRLAAISAEEKELKAELAGLHPQIQDAMIAEGMDSPPGVDGMTAFLTPTYWVDRLIDPDTEEPYGSDDVAEALRQAGYDGMIKPNYNGNQLRGLLREMVDAGQPIPDALARVVKLQRRYEIAVTPMGAAKRRSTPRNGGTAASSS